MERLVAAHAAGGLRRPCCLRRRLVLLPRARFQSSVPAKPYYVTTPIFYVNAEPHIGHMYSMVLADVLKRWQTLQGRRALLCTGTDEHGLKVQQAAGRAGVAAKQFCDENAAVFAELAQRARLAHDFFIRTTDADHVAAVRAIWRRLRRRGFVYRSQHRGWYCVSDETFYPAALVERRVDAATGKAATVSVETGKTVEWTEETNYHFRMTAVREALLAHYAAHPGFVVPASRMAEVVDWVTHQLEDLSISRPASRLTWGVPVPDDASQTVYVWVDALTNYLTKAGYPGRWGGEGQEGETEKEKETEREREREMGTEAETQAGGWPADVHVVGKDIVRFHAVYWPALLLALGLALPRQVLSHAHWTLGRRKMSKSVGNVVNPFYAMDRFGVDALRYYLVHDGGIEHDGDYGNEHIVDRYKKGLHGGLGNLLGRIVRTKRWSVREAVCAGVPEGVPGEAAAQMAVLRAVADEADAHMQRLDPRAALRAVMRVVYETNKFLQREAPWALAKQLDAEMTDSDRARLHAHLHAVVYLAAEALRIVGILLQPVMPDKAAELLDVLGVAADRRTFADAQLGVDADYGQSTKPMAPGPEGSLFPPLPVED